MKNQQQTRKDGYTPPNIPYDEMLRQLEIAMGCKIVIDGNDMHLISNCNVEHWNKNNRIAAKKPNPALRKPFP